VLAVANKVHRLELNTVGNLKEPHTPIALRPLDSAQQRLRRSVSTRRHREDFTRLQPRHNTYYFSLLIQLFGSLFCTHSCRQTASTTVLN